MCEEEVHGKYFIYVYGSIYTLLTVLSPYNMVLYAAYQADPLQGQLSLHNTSGAGPGHGVLPGEICRDDW